MRGKVNNSCSSGCLMKDHPRLCGEKVTDEGNIVTGEGSPPPMRGKAFAPSGILTMIRITPAYAGKSFSVRIPEYHRADHPRLCGEKAVLG